MTFSSEKLPLTLPPGDKAAENTRKAESKACTAAAGTPAGQTPKPVPLPPKRRKVLQKDIYKKVTGANLY